MVMTGERDFPVGHPASADYDPTSPEAREWRRRNVHLKGARDWPVDHPKAIDTPGNTNTVQNIAGVDPARPEYEPFTGRSPAQVEALRAVIAEQTALAKESPVLDPTEAPAPPPPGSIQPPTGQPGNPA